MIEGRPLPGRSLHPIPKPSPSVSDSALPILLLQIVLGLAGLVVAGYGLVSSASELASRLGMSPVMIGLTIVALGTSLPELLVSILDNLNPETSGTLAIGNVVGSNIANIGLILGLGSLIAALPIRRRLLTREYPAMLLVSVVLVAFSIDGTVMLWEGAILLVGLALFMSYSIAFGRAHPEGVETADDSGFWQRFGRWGMAAILAVLGLSLVGMPLSADALVEGAGGLARLFGISELFIGLSIVAIGTSLPELATTLIAIRQGEREIAVGNLVGSNMLNILAIVGITSVIKPLAAPASLLAFDYPIMLLSSALPFLVVWWTGFQARRSVGIPLVCLYAVFCWSIVLNATGRWSWPPEGLPFLEAVARLAGGV